ncbi:MAG TPA: ShET2/EspL2 family type III secretion system effector toxin [Hydrogenophaga sp.]|uniref:ShET2/EspL2 family type III secretion system effector toxin n=1 Tax=Hydrogenophaga sp. TaxID=1904254 RepID=UPI002CDDE12C|nr:ShET2/EspL2 family type III secretion system effector toxin [Hydrogenophaga sp.]HSX94858.1 ShET2/EspL2 family type III secretion system effector toxin [Hydrogenophaga sp.]
MNLSTLKTAFKFPKKTPVAAEKFKTGNVPTPERASHAAQRIQSPEDFAVVATELSLRPVQACQWIKRCPKDLKADLMLHLVANCKPALDHLPKEARASFRASLRWAGKHLIQHRHAEFAQFVQASPKWARRKVASICLELPQAISPNEAVPLMRAAGMTDFDIHQAILRASQHIAESLPDGVRGAMEWYEVAHDLSSSAVGGACRAQLHSPQMIVFGPDVLNLNMKVQRPMIACYQLATQFARDVGKQSLHMKHFSSQEAIAKHVEITRYSDTIRYASLAGENILLSNHDLGPILSGQIQGMRNREESQCAVVVKVCTPIRGLHVMTLALDMLPSRRACVVTLFDPYRTNVVVRHLVDCDDPLQGITLHSYIDACITPEGLSSGEIVAHDGIVLLHLFGTSHPAGALPQHKSSVALKIDGNCPMNAESFFFLMENNYAAAIKDRAESLLDTSDHNTLDEILTASVEGFSNSLGAALELGNADAIVQLRELLTKQNSTALTATLTLQAAHELIKACINGHESAVRAFIGIARTLPLDERFEILKRCRSIAGGFPYSMRGYQQQFPPSYFDIKGTLSDDVKDELDAVLSGKYD